MSYTLRVLMWLRHVSHTHTHTLNWLGCVVCGLCQGLTSQKRSRPPRTSILTAVFSLQTCSTPHGWGGHGGGPGVAAEAEASVSREDHTTGLWEFSINGFIKLVQKTERTHSKRHLFLWSGLPRELTRTTFFWWLREEKKPKLSTKTTTFASDTSWLTITGGGEERERGRARENRTDWRLK